MEKPIKFINSLYSIAFERNFFFFFFLVPKAIKHQPLSRYKKKQTQQQQKTWHTIYCQRMTFKYEMYYVVDKTICDPVRSYAKFQI